jgi:imidazolonepropionase
MEKHLMKVDTLVHSASQLLSLRGGPQRGEALGNLGEIENGALAVVDGSITDVGPSDDLRSRYSAEHEFDAGGRVVMPGFVDPHTHLVWAGERSSEFAMRVAGASYMDIMAAGGGILSTVRQTRAASLEQIVQESGKRLEKMLAHGSTTVEVKTGYALETEGELKLLQAILQLDRQSPVDLVPTFLGAHAIPEAFKDDSDAYTDLVCDEMLPAVRDWWSENAPENPLPFVDVFCETGVFNLDQSRRILERARTLGFPLKIHADEFDGLGGTALAVELGAVSADHLVKTPAADIQALGRSDTVAVALPCTPFGLAHTEYTPAGKIRQAGGLLALATDLNPGTAWCESMQFAIALGCRYMGLTPAQSIVCATINAAAALDRVERIGSLEPGKLADLIVLDVPEYGQMGYRFGVNLVYAVMKRGRWVIPGEEQR